MSKELKIDFFGDGMRIFLDYIERKSKRNPEYRPHPIIRAFMCAFQNIGDLNVDECTMGISQEGTEQNISEPYAVVLQKKANCIEVKEIRNLKVDKTIPVDIMILIFRIQIHIDKIEGETVSPRQFVDVLNAVIPGNVFYALGDRWREARDKFKKMIEEGKIHLPNDPGLINELATLNHNTPWEEYSNKARALIGQSIAPSLNNGKGSIIITSPQNSEIGKSQISDVAINLILGQPAEFFNKIIDNIKA